MTETEILTLHSQLRKTAEVYLKRSQCSVVDADDLVQEGILAVLDGKRKWTRARTAAQSAMLDYLKYKGWNKDNESGLSRVDCDLDALTVTDPEPSGVWWDHFNLDQDDEDALRLRLEDGYNNGEIAAILDTDTNTVQVLLRRGLNVIRQRWEDKGVQAWQLA